MYSPGILPQAFCTALLLASGILYRDSAYNYWCMFKSPNILYALVQWFDLDVFYDNMQGYVSIYIEIGMIVTVIETFKFVLLGQKYENSTL